MIFQHCSVWCIQFVLYCDVFDEQVFNFVNEESSLPLDHLRTVKSLSTKALMVWRNVMPWRIELLLQVFIIIILILTLWAFVQTEEYCCVNMNRKKIIFYIANFKITGNALLCNLYKLVLTVALLS